MQTVVGTAAGKVPIVSPIGIDRTLVQGATLQRADANPRTLATEPGAPIALVVKVIGEAR